MNSHRHRVLDSNLSNKIHRVVNERTAILCRLRKTLGYKIVDHIRQVDSWISIDDPLELFQLLREVTLPSLVAKESQLFDKVRPGHIRVLNDVLESHLHLLLQSLLKLLLNVQLHLIVLLIERLLLLRDKSLRILVRLWQKMLVHSRGSQGCLRGTWRSASQSSWSKWLNIDDILSRC